MAETTCMCSINHPIYSWCFNTWSAFKQGFFNMPHTLCQGNSMESQLNTYTKNLFFHTSSYPCRRIKIHITSTYHTCIYLLKAAFLCHFLQKAASTWWLFLAFEFKRQGFWGIGPWFGGLGGLLLLEPFLVVLPVSWLWNCGLCYWFGREFSLSLYRGTPGGRSDSGWLRSGNFHFVLRCPWQW